MTKQLFLVAGKPGSGKSTTAGLAAQQLTAVYHFSMGDELRARALHGKPSRYTDTLKQYVTELKLNQPVPTELAAHIFEECVETSPVNTIIVDGYPQYTDELAGFADSLKRVNAQVMAICTVDLSDEAARNRLTGRPQRSPDVMEDAAYINKRLAGYRTNAQPTIQALAQYYTHYVINGTRDQTERADELVRIIEQHRSAQ